MTGRGSLADLPDAALVDSVRADPDGESGRRAACELLSRHRIRVYAWCFQRLGDADHALDVTQEVLLNAYRGLRTFHGRSAFSSWLFVIARNRCMSEMRRPRLLIDEESQPDDLRSQTKDPATLYLEGRSEEEVLDLIRRELEPLEQQVLWLRCFERMAVDRITAVLGIEEASGARGVLQRARRRLREALRRRGPASEVSP